MRNPAVVVLCAGTCVCVSGGELLFTPMPVQSTSTESGLNKCRLWEDLCAWDVIVRDGLRCWTDDGDGAWMQRTTTRSTYVCLETTRDLFCPPDVNPSTMIGYSGDYVTLKARVHVEKEGIEGEFTTTTSFRVCFIGGDELLNL